MNLIYLHGSFHGCTLSHRADRRLWWEKSFLMSQKEVSWDSYISSLVEIDLRCLLLQMMFGQLWINTKTSNFPQLSKMAITAQRNWIWFLKPLHYHRIYNQEFRRIINFLLDLNVGETHDWKEIRMIQPVIACSLHMWVFPIYFCDFFFEWLSYLLRLGLYMSEVFWNRYHLRQYLLGDII